MIEPVNLLRISPNIWGLDNLICCYMFDILVDRLPTQPGNVLRDCTQTFAYFKDEKTRRADEFGHPIPSSDATKKYVLESSLEVAFRILKHPNIERISDGGLAEMREAIEVMIRSEDAVELTQAAELLVEAAFEFWEYFYDQLPNELLGEWGAELFRFFLTEEDPKPLRTLAKGVADTPNKGLKTESVVVVDEAQFTVCIGQRTPCFLGNTQQFRLLAQLVAQEGQFLSFQDLAAAIAVDLLDDAVVKVAKSRLCSALKARGYKDVADSIVTQRGHYCFKPAGGAIET